MSTVMDFLFCRYILYYIMIIDDWTPNRIWWQVKKREKREKLIFGYTFLVFSHQPIPIPLILIILPLMMRMNDSRSLFIIRFHFLISYTNFCSLISAAKISISIKWTEKGNCACTFVGKEEEFHLYTLW